MRFDKFKLIAGKAVASTKDFCTLLFELSTDVPYYGYYPNEWHESYMVQQYVYFKEEKGNWCIRCEWGYCCPSLSEIDTDSEVKQFFDKLKVRQETCNMMLSEK